MEKTVLWTTNILDSADGSGDAIIEIPEELLAQLGWHIGDTLDVIVEDGKYIRLTKLTSQE